VLSLVRFVRAIPFVAVLAAAVIGGCADRTKPDNGTKPAEVDDDAAADATTATEQAASFTHPAEIAEWIADAGLGCEDFEDVPEPNPEVDLAGTCTLANGTRATIEVMATAERYAGYVRLGQDVGCQYFPGSRVYYATGDYWGVSHEADLVGDEWVTDAETLGAVAEAVGGELAYLDC
jgi:hypothetical protein